MSFEVKVGDVVLVGVGRGNLMSSAVDQMEPQALRIVDAGA